MFLLFLLLQLSLDSVWLRESGAGGGRASFFPDNRNRHFDFSADVGFLIQRLTVEGSAASGSSNRIFSSSSIIGSQRPPSTVVPVGNKKNSISVKIVQASVKKSASGGRPDFKPLSQAFVDITESTANVMYLSHIIKEKWGADYVLITADGMRIEDGSGTQGKPSQTALEVSHQNI